MTRVNSNNNDLNCVAFLGTLNKNTILEYLAWVQVPYIVTVHDFVDLDVETL